MPIPIWLKIGASIMSSPWFQERIKKVGKGLPVSEATLIEMMKKMPEDQLKKIWGDRYPLMKQWLSGETSQEEMEQQYEKGLEEGLYTGKDVKRSQQLDEMIQRFTSYDTGKKRQEYMQRMASAQESAQRQNQEALGRQYAARTGGRVPPPPGAGAPTGKFALAQQVGGANIEKILGGQERQMQTAGLRAYLQKYGVDQNSMQAMQRMKLQSEMEQANYWNDLMGNIGQGAAQYGPDVVNWLGNLGDDKFKEHTSYY